MCSRLHRNYFRASDPERSYDRILTATWIVLLLVAAIVFVGFSIVRAGAEPITQHGTFTVQAKGQRYTGAATFTITPRTRAAAKRLRAKPRTPRAAFTSRECLTPDTRALLGRLEARFGAVKLAKTCVPGARMPSGRVSWHARNKAFDFHVPKGARHGEVMVWLKQNSPGVTIGYSGRLAGIIHTDTGNFKMIIYRAASHEAGERAVKIWMARGQEAARIASLLPPRLAPQTPRAPLEPAPWTATAAYVDPDFETISPPPPTVPLKPETFDTRWGAFWRNQGYVDSKDIEIKPWVKFSCPGGKEMPRPIQTMLRDAAAHWQRTVYVNSAYRSPAYNRKVGGARQSQHMKCRAVDFRVAGVTPRKVRDWLVVNRSKWGITAIGTYGTHTHADDGVRSKRSNKLVEWTGGGKRKARYAKRRAPPTRYAVAS